MTILRKDLEIGMLVMWERSTCWPLVEAMVVDTEPWKIVKEWHATKPWRVDVARRSKPGGMGVAMAKRLENGMWVPVIGFLRQLSTVKEVMADRKALKEQADARQEGRIDAEAFFRGVCECVEAAGVLMRDPSPMLNFDRGMVYMTAEQFYALAAAVTS